MHIPLVDLKTQHRSIQKEIQEALEGVLSETSFVMGPEVRLFEEEMAAYLGIGFAVGVGSGTDALHLSLLAMGIGQGDEVITTPFTFIATAEAISLTGAKPVFVDIDPQTFNLNAEEIKRKITPRTRAVLPVHLFGHPAPMDQILEVADRFGLSVVEDCAQAAGAEYKGKKTGTMGDLGCFSFFPSKNLGACGDGGMVVTNNEKLAEGIRVLRSHGSKEKYYYKTIGFNSRLDTIQAAILRVKLRHLDDWNEKRRRIADYYEKCLSTSGTILPCEAPLVKHVYHQYTIRAEHREELKDYLKEMGVETSVYYPLSLHLQEVYRDLGYRRGDFPESEKAQEEVLSLPMFPELEEEQVARIAFFVKEFMRECRSCLQRS